MKNPPQLLLSSVLMHMPSDFHFPVAIFPSAMAVHRGVGGERVEWDNDVERPHGSG